MIKLLSLFAFLLLASNVYGLDRAKDCKCRLPTQTKIVNGKFAAHFPWSVTFFERMKDNLSGNCVVLRNILIM